MTSEPTKPKPEWRLERNFPSRLMGVIEGYAIVRRKGCMPYCVPMKDWENLPVVEG